MTQNLMKTFSGETAIVADDDAVTREILCTLLRFAGLKILAEAGTGDEALNAFLAHRPKIVCLDIKMPGLNGLEVLTQIRALSEKTIVVIISGVTTSENLYKAVTERANLVIRKPFDVAQVIASIEQAVRKSSSAEERAISGQIA